MCNRRSGLEFHLEELNFTLKNVFLNHNDYDGLGGVYNLQKQKNVFLKGLGRVHVECQFWGGLDLCEILCQAKCSNIQY